ncbi:MAG: glycosyltransferase, partial [Rhodothermales bacterium]
MKRVLFVTYYFPPSGGSGVQRALKFAKYLPHFGWEPTILTVRPEDAAYPDLDATLSRDVPPGLRVERTRAWDPYALYARLQGKVKSETVGVGFVGEGTMNRTQRFARWLRANVFLPDARVGWVPFALCRGSTLLEDGSYDAILTTGPPH